MTVVTDAKKKTETGMKGELERVIDCLHKERGFDFTGYRPAMVERRVSKRLTATNSVSCREYLDYLKKNPDEITNLLDVLTINVSGFFRDTLNFEYIAKKILPAVVLEKIEGNDLSLRVWSTACSTGEEPYSIAILIRELLDKEDIKLNPAIFATDIDKGAISKAKEAVYPFESIKNIRYGLLKKYFAIEEDSFTLRPEIKELVNFSLYDMLDKKSSAPPESVFGSFDIVLCCNLLIYFHVEYQGSIFDKLYHSLAKNGYLVLGEAETLPIKYQHSFRKVEEWRHIYQKIG